MSNETVLPGETPTTPAPETGAVTNQADAKPAVTVEALQAELEATRKALKDANKEAAERRKRLDAIEKADKEKADAELSETEKLKRELESTAARLKAAETDNLKRRIAAETSLPAELIDRLRGETEDELKADAQALLKLIPKVKLGATNPGNARQETVYEQGARLKQETASADIWSGGGVKFIDRS